MTTSGFCNPTLPRTAGYDPHQNCRGCDCTALGCPCSPTSPATLPTALDDLDAATVAVNVAAAGPGGIDSLDWVDALHHLGQLRGAVETLRQLDSLLVRHLYLHGEHGKRVVDGLGEVWIGRGRAKERWEGPAAIQDYVERCIMATDGEVPDPRQVVEWVLEVLPANPSTNLRVTPLRTAGLDVEDYRTSEPGSLSVTLPTSRT